MDVGCWAAFASSKSKYFGKIYKGNTRFLTLRRIYIPVYF